MIIGISGKFSAGKDLIADRLTFRWGFTKKGFADKLKSLCVDLFGMTNKDRTLLQAVGSKMREVDPMVWVRYPFKDYHEGDNLVINDVRYKNEFEYIRSMGGILIRVNCIDTVRMDRYSELYHETPSLAQLMHPSETDLDGFPFDFTIDTSYATKDEAREHIDHVIKMLQGDL